MTESEDESCKVLKIIDKCQNKGGKWYELPCIDCKYNPSRYFKLIPFDRYEKVM